ncbi:MAG TPA: succinate dehydrogenase flavoprotein subunit [Thermomicrobiales bacterium]|nr:succinate dehydrogenase flavoprotein subunit [Thermomicrobiales bacterium]
MASSARPTHYHKHDVIIVGAGGAGLMASMQVAEVADVAVISKLYPSRSHTGAAQGGIGAALGNMEEDHWEWHMFDTVKGGDYLTDQDAAEVLAREAVDAVYELEHMGLPFSRTPEGKIAQRRFGGHTSNYGEAAVMRSCYAADRTGHMILQTLFQQGIRHNVNFFDEFQVLDFLVSDGQACGVVAHEIRTGELHTFHAKAVIFATGGFGRVFAVTSNALANTGDGVAIPWRRGLPLEDMEMFQFHPTGIYKLGILLSEAARGEGGILRNSEGEAFAKRYAPTLADLAPRDMVSRFIYQEVKEGRGIDGKDYVYLDLRHIPAEVQEQKLPDITEFIRVYLGVDPTKEMAAIQPTAHYGMGGLPTDVDGRVLVSATETLPGFYAAGECACVSVHGANRLGTNSLVDLVVFGRRAGKAAARFIKDADYAPLPPDPEGFARDQVERLLSRADGPTERPGEIRRTLQVEMFDKAGVVRNAQKLREMQDILVDLQQRYQRVAIDDHTRHFNTDLLEALELGYLLDVAECIVAGALARTESRGAHYREDYPDRDDANWLKHTLVYKTSGGVRLDSKPVSITTFQPKERKY